MHGFKRLAAVAAISIGAMGAVHAQTPPPAPQAAPSIEVKKVTFLVSLEELMKVCEIQVDAPRLARLAQLRDVYISKTTASGEIQPTAIPTYRERVTSMVTANKTKACEPIKGDQIKQMLDNIFVAEESLAAGVPPVAPSVTAPSAVPVVIAPGTSAAPAPAAAPDPAAVPVTR